MTIVLVDFAKVLCVILSIGCCSLKLLENCMVFGWSMVLQTVGGVLSFSPWGDGLKHSV